MIEFLMIEFLENLRGSSDKAAKKKFKLIIRLYIILTCKLNYYLCQQYAPSNKYWKKIQFTTFRNVF